jgi:hypothetical protein
MGTKNFSNANDLITFSRASGGTALRKVAYGPELVTNGDFSTDSDWTKGTGWTISGGQASHASGANSNINVAENISTRAGALYLFEFDLISNSSNFLWFSIDGVYTAVDNYNTGNKRLVFQADSSSTLIGVRAGSSNDCVIDNISIREVLFDDASGDLTLFNHPADVPRIEYDADGNVLGLLVEEARTNLVTYSEDFSNAAWPKTNVSVTSDAAVSPDGAANADFLIEGVSTSQHLLRRINSPEFTPDQIYSYSVFAKRNGRDIQLLLFKTSTFASAKFNLTSGEVDSVSAGSAEIKDFGNGWYKCSVTGTCPSGASGGSFVDVSLLDGSFSTSYTGDGVSGAYIYGAQLEAGAFPTSYIPTDGATATRSADVASIPVADFGFHPNSKGTLFVEVKTPEVDQIIAGVAYFNSTSFQNSAGFSKANSGNTQAGGRYLFAAFGGGNTILDVTDANTGNFVKLAGVFGDGMLAVADGGAVLSGTEQTPVPTHLRMGGRDNGYQSRCHIKSINYYPRRLTNAQLEALTAPRSSETLFLTFDGLESSFTEKSIHG